MHAQPLTQGAAFLQLIEAYIGKDITGVFLGKVNSNVRVSPKFSHKETRTYSLRGYRHTLTLPLCFRVAGRIRTRRRLNGLCLLSALGN